MSLILKGYDLRRDYKTSPPVGWKRPPSQATQLARSIFEKSSLRQDEAAIGSASSQADASGSSARKSTTKTDRDLYLEAIYREDSSGKIFMKYLMSKNKIVCFFRSLILKNYHFLISLSFSVY